MSGDDVTTNKIYVYCSRDLESIPDSLVLRFDLVIEKPGTLFGIKAVREHSFYITLTNSEKITFCKIDDKEKTIDLYDTIYDYIVNKQLNDRIIKRYFQPPNDSRYAYSALDKARDLAAEVEDALLAKGNNLVEYKKLK